MGQPSAGPVHVLVGHSQGQGYTFTLGRSCYAYTAGHVLSRPGGSVLLTNRQAFQAKARVIAIDSRLDLGLLQVDPDGMRPSKVCDGGTPQLIQPGALMSAARTGLPHVWMDTIASQSGELDRLELSLRPEGIGETRLLLSPTSGNKRRVESRTPQSGDSGASVFGSPRDSERGRYGADGTPTARQVGLLLGVHVGVKGDQSLLYAPTRYTNLSSRRCSRGVGKNQNRAGARETASVPPRCLSSGIARSVLATDRTGARSRHLRTRSGRKRFQSDRRQRGDRRFGRRGCFDEAAAFNPGADFAVPAKRRREGALGAWCLRRGTRTPTERQYRRADKPALQPQRPAQHARPASRIHRQSVGTEERHSAGRTATVIDARSFA